MFPEANYFDVRAPFIECSFKRPLMSSFVYINGAPFIMRSSVRAPFNEAPKTTLLLDDTEKMLCLC